MAQSCEHLGGLSAGDFPPPEPSDGCAECLVEGTRWVALRECRSCGHVGCCDSSPGTHATKHNQQTQHPVMRSVMPGDTWTWCYPDQVMGELAGTG
ncbi:MAG: UBP-type zinc finger domain-containing protein [Pseudonocardiales bacterium]